MLLVKLFGGFTPPAAWQTTVVVFHNLERRNYYLDYLYGNNRTQGIPKS